MPAIHDPAAYESKQQYPHRVTHPEELIWPERHERMVWLTRQPGKLGRYSVCQIMDGRTQFQFELEKTAILYKLRWL